MLEKFGLRISMVPFTDTAVNRFHTVLEILKFKIKKQKKFKADFLEFSVYFLDRIF